MHNVAIQIATLLHTKLCLVLSVTKQLMCNMQSGGRLKYIGKSAAVVLNQTGKVVTT